MNSRWWASLTAWLLDRIIPPPPISVQYVLKYKLSIPPSTPHWANERPTSYTWEFVIRRIVLGSSQVEPCARAETCRLCFCQGLDTVVLYITSPYFSSIDQPNLPCRSRPLNKVEHPFNSIDRALYHIRSTAQAGTEWNFGMRTSGKESRRAG